MNRSILKFLGLIIVLLSSTLTVLAQAQTVKGVVTGANGDLLPGVTVIIKGTSIGTITDLNGTYSINVEKTDMALEFSFLGYEKQAIVVGNQSIIDVILLEDSREISELIVVGYGTQKKSDITGTVASLPDERLEMVPNVDVSQAIQGAMPGVRITLSDAGAAPSNDNSSIMIRGRNSIKASNAPLIVVDEVPYYGQLRDISPNDIKSIEVLKDASSAAIYGSRGANGVILITTKKGVEGQVKLAYDGFFSTKKLASIPDFMTGEEFYDFKMEREPLAMTASEQSIYDKQEWTNWADETMRTGYSHQHNLSLVGGNKKTKYYIAANLLDVHSVAKNDDYKRISTRVNIDADIKPWLTLGTRTSLSYEDRSGEAPSFSSAFWMNPLTKAYNDDGTLTIYPWEDDPYFGNPLQSTLYDNTNTGFQVTTSSYLKVDVPYIKGLQYRINLGTRHRYRDVATYRGRDTKVGLEKSGTSDIARYQYENITLENILDYNFTVKKNSIALTAVYGYESYNRSANELYARGYPHDILTSYSAAQAEYLSPSYDEYTESDLISQMLRANYNYDSRYLFTFTYRRDGSSRFGSNNRWGDFPSLALGWNIANESFFNNDKLDVLKLRASWGKNGNQAVTPYSTISRLSSLDNIISGATAPGYVPSKLGEDNLGWETTSSSNIGLDYVFLDNRISGDINLYNSTTTDLLLDRAISSIHGITTVTQNIGEVNNKGIEFAINSVNISSSNIVWSTNANFSYTKNKIVSLYGDLGIDGEELDDTRNKWFIDQPIGVNYDFQFDGVWQEDEAEEAALYGQQPGFVKLLDVNGDYILDANDKTIQGQTDPSFIWGLTNTITFSGFTFSFFIHGVHGLTKENDLWSVDVWNEVRRNTVNRDWWTPDNPTNEIYSNVPNSDKQSGNTVVRFEDASFIRLKDLTIAYDIPETLTSKLKLTKFRLYFTGRNLMTHTSWTGLDPELESQRSVPLSKEYVFGMNIGF